jgi:hypothetical protein
MQTNAISFPIYLLLKDCGDVITFASSEKMQGDLEAIDVENNEYEAWDADGRLLQLRVASEKFDWLQITKTDKVLSNVDFAEIKEKAIPYRDSESVLKGIGRRLGLLKADD